ncbi:MAG TPA: glycoside hydrolase family 31 protein, partial [Candidatus Atribacteria bacterium]|nr:glycoside hydrolase family 31 protein [Candidatus Atribacteria bacterium]
GLCGFGFWSHDIGGFDSSTTPDLYKRWVAFGLLSSHSRLHGNNAYKVPWLYDEEAVEVLKFFVELKCSLMPYLWKEAWEAKEKGIPMLRAMVLEFEEDPTCHYLDRQYMLGDSLLVAPVFSEDGEVEYYLPAGIWTNLITNEKKEGGRWYREKYDYFSLPLMVRPHSIIAIGDRKDVPDYDYTSRVVLHVFELKEGKEVKTWVINQKGEVELELSIIKEGNKISINIEKGYNKEFKIFLNGISQVERVINGSFAREEKGTFIIPQKECNNIEVILK